MTLDSVPHIGRLDDRTLVSMGYNGAGVAMSSLMGRYLAAFVRGETPEVGLLDVSAHEGHSVLSAARARRAHGRRLVPVSRCDRSVRLLGMEEARMMTKQQFWIGLRDAGRNRIDHCGERRRADHLRVARRRLSGGADVAILDPSAKKLGITINQDSIPDAWPRDQDAGRQRQADLGRRRYPDRQLPARRRAGADREARLLEDPQRRGDAGGLSQSLFGGVRVLFQRARLQPEDIPEGRAEQLGRFLGREEIPRPPRAAQPSDRARSKPR